MSLVESSSEEVDVANDDAMKIGIITGCVVLLVIAGYCVFLLLVNWPIDNLQIAHSGLFGDSFGPLTAAFSGLAFSGLIATLVYQRKTFQLQRKEFVEMRDELREARETRAVEVRAATFYRLLTIHSEILQGVEVEFGDNKILRGRNCFKELRVRLFTRLKVEPNKFFVHTGSIELKGFENFWDMYRGVLAHYIRYTGQMLCFIDNAPDGEQGEYIDMLRSQYSDYELIVLYYLTLESSKFQEFSGLSEKYGFFKDLPPDLLHEGSSA